MLFQRFGLRDFARIDGWFLPSHVNVLSSPDNVGKFGNTKSGTIIFTDINLVSYISVLLVIKISNSFNVGICPQILYVITIYLILLYLFV